MPMAPRPAPVGYAAGHGHGSLDGSGVVQGRPFDGEVGEAEPE